MANDEIATLATDDVGVPIGRGDAIGSPVRGLAPVVCLAIQITDAATQCDGCDQLAVRRGGLKPGRRAGSGRPVGGTPAGIFTGRVLRDGRPCAYPATGGVSV